MLRLAVLGDSIAYGVGADHPSDTLAPRVSAELAGRAVPTEFRVFAVPGARSADLASQVRRAVVWAPHIAIAVVGANDLTHFVRPAAAGRALREAVRELRSAAAEVVVAPAPDLSVVPALSTAMRHVVRRTSAPLRRAQVAATLEAGGRVADVDGATSGRFGLEPSLFSADRFHPSSAGYRVIAETLTPLVLEAAAAVSDGWDGPTAGL